MPMRSEAKSLPPLAEETDWSVAEMSKEYSPDGAMGWPTLRKRFMYSKPAASSCLPHALVMEAMASEFSLAYWKVL